jgi:hypothetical protein
MKTTLEFLFEIGGAVRRSKRENCGVRRDKAFIATPDGKISELYPRYGRRTENSCVFVARF